MAIHYYIIKIISRDKGRSAGAAAAYRCGETITNEYDGVTHGYTRKSGIIHTEILLPDNAPPSIRIIKQIPTVHLGAAASQMERRGIRIERGGINSEIGVTNANLRQLKVWLVKLQSWLKEEMQNTEPPTLADFIQEMLSRKTQTGKSQYSQSLHNLKDAANVLNF